MKIVENTDEVSTLLPDIKDFYNDKYLYFLSHLMCSDLYWSQLRGN